MLKRQFLAGSVMALASMKLGMTATMAQSSHSEGASAPAAPSYPAASAASGAPFADVNFKFVVLSSLMDVGVVNVGTPSQLASHLLGRPVEVEDNEPMTEVQDYLARYPLTDDILARVESISFEGAKTIYRYIQERWDYETFWVNDISDIHLCPNVSLFDANSMVGAVDIRHLVPLRKLEQLTCRTGIEHLEALLDLPALKQLTISDDRIFDEASIVGHPTRRLLSALKSKGVDVSVGWISRTFPSRPTKPI